METMATSPNIFEASKACDVDSIETMVKYGADINAFDEEGKTPFSVMVEAYYGLLNENDPRGLYERTENFLPFEDRERDIVPALKRMLALGADINAAKMMNGFCENALFHALWAQDIHMVRFLLKRGADPNFVYEESSDAGTWYPDTLDRIYTEQSTFHLLVGEDRFAVAKRLADLEALLIEYGVRTELDDAAKAVFAASAKENDPDVEFKYRLHDIGWIECDIYVGEQHASFSMSHIGNGPDRLMQVLFALAFENSNWLECTYEVCDVLFDQGGSHITLHLEETEGKLLVQVWEDSGDEQGDYLINAVCSKGRFLYHAVKAYDLMIKKNGFVGYVRSFKNCCPQPELYLPLKAYVLCIEYQLHYVDDDGTFRTSFADEMALFEMVV